MRVDFGEIWLKRRVCVGMNYAVYETRGWPGYLVLVPVPVGPGLGDLAAELAGAAAVVVDHVVEGDVAPGQLLLLRDDQGAVDICTGSC